MKFKTGIALIVFFLLSAIFISIAFAGTTSYTYDGLNRLTKVDYGNGKYVEYTYDSVGNRKTLISRILCFGIISRNQSE